MPSVRDTTVWASGFTTGSQASATLDKPVGTTSGDLLIAWIVASAESGNVNETPITPPSGWTLLRREEGFNTPFVRAVYTKTAGGSEPANYTWLADNPIPGTLSMTLCGVMYCLMGSIATPAIAGVGNENEDLTQSTFDTPAGIAEGALVILFGAGQRGDFTSITHTPPGSGDWTEREDSSIFGSVARFAINASDKAFPTDPPQPPDSFGGTYLNSCDNVGMMVAVNSVKHPLQASLQGVGALTPGLSASYKLGAALQGVGSLTPALALHAKLQASLQGVGQISRAFMQGTPSLDFTVYDLYVDDGTSVVGHLLHEDEETKSTERANPARTEKTDVGQNPFELRPEFGDPFAQGDFSHGADQVYFHQVGRDAKKYLASEGFDISEPGLLRHVHEMAEGFDSTSVVKMTVADGLIFVTNGTSIRRGNGAFPGVWTDDPPHVAEGAQTVHDVTSRGDEVFAACDTNGVHIRSAAGTWSHFQPDGATNLVVGTATRVAWLKDRLFVAGTGGREAFEVVSDSTPTAIKTLPVGWTFESFFEAGAFVYATSVNVDAGMSRVHIFGLNSAGTFIEDKGSVPIPRGELIFAGIGDPGGIFLGGGKINTAGGYDPIFYQAIQGETGFLQLLKITEGEGGSADCSIQAFESLGDEIVFSWPLGTPALTGARTGVARYHLGNQAFSQDLKKTGAGTAQIPSILSYKGRIVFTIEGDGLYYEDVDNFVAEAYLISSIADWSSAGLKVWDLLQLSHKELPSTSSVIVEYTTKHPEENEWNQAISNSVAGSEGTSNRLTDVASRLFAVKLRSFATTDQSNHPQIQSFSVRSNPTRPEPEYILTRFVRLLAKDKKDPQAPWVYKDPAATRIALEFLLDSWVTIYEPGVTWTAFVKDIATVKPAEPFISATNGEPLKEAYLVRLDMVATGDAT